MHIGIVTTYSPEYAPLAALTLKNKEVYCAHHGYTLIVDQGPIDYSQPLNWIKIRALTNHLTCFDWLLWSDIDSLFMNREKKLEDFIVPHVSLVAGLFKIAKNTDHLHTLIAHHFIAYTLHTGNFLLKNDSFGERILRYLSTNETWRTHDLMDEAALTDLYRHSPELRSRTRLLRIEDVCTVPPDNMMRWVFPVYTPGNFIVHFLGKEYSPDEKLALVRAWTGEPR